MFVIVLCQVIYQKQMQEDIEETVKTVLGIDDASQRL